MLVAGIALAQSASARAATLSPVRHVRVGAIKVGYRQGGSGPPLVLIMGRGATMAEWDPRLLAELMRTRRVTVFDNHGVANTSGTSGDDLTVGDMADDTYGLMRRLKIHKADVLGWSMGGYIAQQLTLDHPKAVRRLVLCATDAGGSHYVPPTEAVQEILDSPDLTATELFDLSFPDTTAGKLGKLRYLLAVAEQSGLTVTDFTLGDTTKAQQEHATSLWKASGGGSYDELRSVRQRVLVADGKHDELAVVKNSRILARRLPKGQLKVYGTAGHGFLFQDAVAFGRRVVKFLGD